jgi:Flp pilus assembly protein TadG
MKDRKPISHKVIRQKGAAVIEFAIVLPLLVLIVTGLIEYGRLMWNYNALAKATRDAARYLSTVEAKDWNAEATTANSMVMDAAASAGVDTTGLTTNITCEKSDGGSIACTSIPTDGSVTVAVNYEFTIGGWIPVVGMAIKVVELRPHTTMPYLRLE